MTKEVRFYDTVLRRYITLPVSAVRKVERTSSTGRRYTALVGRTSGGREVVRVVEKAEWEGLRG